MVDHGERARAEGKQAFSEILDLSDAAESIQHQSNRLAMWLKLPNVLPLYYDDVAYNSEETVRRIANQIGIECSPKQVTRIAKRKFTQFHKGIPNRYLEEMTEKNSRKMARHFSPMFKRLIDRRSELEMTSDPVLGPRHGLNRYSDGLWTRIRNTFTFSSETRKIL